MAISFDGEDTVGKVRSILETKLGVASHLFYLVHSGKVLRDSRTISDHRITGGAIIHVTARLNGGARSQHSNDTTTVRITVANVTHLPTAMDALLAVEGDVYCVQEHTLGASK